jgi:hypothetical protein
LLLQQAGLCYYLDMESPLIWFSGLSFMFYGSLILLSDHMKREFRRYNMARFRTLTGVLELLGGVGLIVGLSYAPVLRLSSVGLATLMLMGTIVRIKVKDRPVEILPAFVLLVINAVIFLKSL